MQAQPTLKTAYDLQPGYSYTYKEITNASNYQNIATVGANLTWDFTGIQLAANTRTDSILSIQQSSFPVTFAGASFVLREPNGLQQFYEVAQDTVYYLGNSTNNQASVFSPGMPIYSLPINYPTILSEKYAQNTAPGYSEPWKGAFRYEAYGTLDLPNNVSYSNVGLYVGFTGERNGNVIFLNYSFFRENDRIPLLRIQLQQTGSTAIVQTAFLTETFPSIGLTKPVAESAIVVYPNPAHNKVQVANLSSRGSTVSIFNLNGIRVSVQVTRAKNLSLELSDLPRGLYIIEVKTKDEVSRRPLVID
jgi:hypothetical protein